MNTGFDLGTLGRWLVAAGIAFVVIGAALLALMRLGGLEHLPGTICWQTGGVTCVVPLLLSLVLSVSLTVVLNLIIRWLLK